MCIPDFSIVVTARKSRGGDTYTTYTLHVPLASVLKPQDVPLSNQELSELFLRSKMSFHMVQLEQILSDETRTHILTTVLPFVQQRASPRFSPGLPSEAKIRDSKRTLDTHKYLNRLGLLFMTLLCLASSAGIGYLLYIWIGAAGLSLFLLPVLCAIRCGSVANPARRPGLTPPSSKRGFGGSTRMRTFERL